MSKANDRPNILFCISDDQSWVHTGAAGDVVVRTPAFDRIAAEGVLFTNAYCTAPSCTPSRGSVLTGRMFWELQAGGNLWSALPNDFPVYPDLLEKAGYFIGLMKKGWGPGNAQAGGWIRNPAGPTFRSFEEFMAARPPRQPFCFWFGSYDPHRPYELGAGIASGMKLDQVRVPPFLSDCEIVRSDILDYLFEVERYDRDCQAMIDFLEARGELDNTLIVITSDNGMPFPRAKANLYDFGTRVPLAVRWPERVPGGRRIEDFISFADFAPTFLEAADLPIPETMSGKSFLRLLTQKAEGRVDLSRDHVFTGRERHAWCRDGLGYPCRAIRTYDYLYIRNYAPDRWPAGEPEEYRDIDPGPTKEYMKAHRDDPEVGRFFEMAFGKRPEEELFDLRNDPNQLTNVAADPKYALVKQQLAAQLEAQMTITGDLRPLGGAELWDTCEYYGDKQWKW
ncbi:MAG: sulfatase family protein [Candidatus Zipacnadales bacterium]